MGVEVLCFFTFQLSMDVTLNKTNNLIWHFFLKSCVYFTCFYFAWNRTIVKRIRDTFWKRKKIPQFPNISMFIIYKYIYFLYICNHRQMHDVFAWKINNLITMKSCSEKPVTDHRQIFRRKHVGFYYMIQILFKWHEAYGQNIFF